MNKIFYILYLHEVFKIQHVFHTYNTISNFNNYMWLEDTLGEGDGTPLQYSCLENPRDGGAWWAAVCGVTQSQTQLK